jgi:hypothetical protein
MAKGYLSGGSVLSTCKISVTLISILILFLILLIQCILRAHRRRYPWGFWNIKRRTRKVAIGFWTMNQMLLALAISGMSAYITWTVYTLLLCSIKTNMLLWILSQLHWSWCICRGCVLQFSNTYGWDKKAVCCETRFSSWRMGSAVTGTVLHDCWSHIGWCETSVFAWDCSSDGHKVCHVCQCPKC